MVEMDNNSKSCPVKHSNTADNKNSGCPVQTSPQTNGVWQWMTSFVIKPKATQAPNSNAVVTYPGQGNYNPTTNDYEFDSKKLDTQTKNLNTKRSMSTIPKDEFSPSHQPTNVTNWVYPSEQQYFNAIKKKGYEAREDDIPVVLAIHNFVNEEAWIRIREWERLRGCDNPVLKRFTGRPNDISPKAFIGYLFGYSLPFDRHDWIISRNGADVRYVIDFYKGKETTTKLPNAANKVNPVSIYLDVRPALDSVTAAYDRMYVSLTTTLFGSADVSKRNIPAPKPPIAGGK